MTTYQETNDTIRSPSARQRSSLGATIMVLSEKVASRHLRQSDSRHHHALGIGGYPRGHRLVTRARVESGVRRRWHRTRCARIQRGGGSPLIDAEYASDATTPRLLAWPSRG